MSKKDPLREIVLILLNTPSEELEALRMTWLEQCGSEDVSRLILEVCEDALALVIEHKRAKLQATT